MMPINFSAEPDGGVDDRTRGDYSTAQVGYNGPGLPVGGRPIPDPNSWAWPPTPADDDRLVDLASWDSQTGSPYAWYGTHPLA